MRTELVAALLLVGIAMYFAWHVAMWGQRIVEGLPL